jgi:hypothetical protein
MKCSRIVALLLMMIIELLTHTGYVRYGVYIIYELEVLNLEIGYAEAISPFWQ